jgi:hypothetical protein
MLNMFIHNLNIYNVFIPFYPKKSIKTPFGALIFQQIGQRFPLADFVHIWHSGWV